MAYVQYASGRTKLPFNTSNVTITNDGSLGVAGTIYLSIQGENRVGRNKNSVLVPVTLTATSKLSITIPPLLNSEDWQNVIVSASLTNDVNTLTQIVKVNVADIGIPLILSSERIFKLTLNDRTVANASSLPLAPEYGLIRYVAALNYYYEYDKFSTKVPDGLNVLSATVGRWYRVASSDTYISDTTLPGGCDRDIRTPDLKVTIPDYPVDGSKGAGVVYWMRNDYTEVIPSGTRVSTIVKLYEEDRSQLFSGLIVLELLGYVNLTTTVLDTSVSSGEILFDPNKRHLTLTEDLPSGHAAVVRVSPKFRIEHLGNVVPFGAKLSVNLQFVGTTGVYSPGVFGNVIYAEYDKWRIVPELGLSCRKLKGSGIVDRYELNAIGEDSITGLIPQTAAQYIYLTSNSTAFSNTSNDLESAVIRAVVGTVDGEGIATSYGNITVNSTSKVGITIYYPTDIRSNYPDTTIAGVSKGVFNASSVIFYLKSGSAYYRSEKVISPGALVDTFKLDWIDFTASSLPTVAANFGLYKPTSVSTTVIAEASSFSTTTYEVFVAFKYINTVTTIDHSVSQLVETIANLAEILDSISTQWFTGSGVPSSGLGINNDLYLNTTNSDIYKKVNDTWTLVASIKGQTGASPTLSIAAVNSVSPTTPANVTLGGTQLAPTLTFNIPQGIQGEAATMQVGSVSTGTPSVTNSGTTDAAILDFVLPAGIPGAAGTVSVGTVTALNPNQSPTVANGGTGNAAVLNFGLPRSPAFTVGSVTTGASGSNASVINAGTNGDIVLNFTIPQGAAGTLSATSSVSLIPSTSPSTASNVIGVFADSTNNRLKYRLQNNGLVHALATTSLPQQYDGVQGINIQNITFSTTLSVDLSLSNTYSLTLNNDVSSFDTINLKQATYIFLIKQDSTGGRIISGYSSKFKFPNGTVPTLSSAANKTDMLTCISDGTSLYCTLTPGF
ncbi:hypothetical protein [Scytonema sp. NUACC26]|uniref:hypothetical protein n=1 Tax=Scytonema sp. NUACC26 TaxID=3140176 RepID=UPI0034DC789D